MGGEKSKKSANESEKNDRLPGKRSFLAVLTYVFEGPEGGRRTAFALRAAKAPAISFPAPRCMRVQGREDARTESPIGRKIRITV